MENAQSADIAQGSKVSRSTENAETVGGDSSDWTDIETPSKTFGLSEEEFDSAMEDARDVAPRDIKWLQDDYQSQKQVLMTVDVHQEELCAETVEQGSFGQEGLPTATTLQHFTVQTCNNETRERVSQLVKTMSNAKGVDSAYESTVEHHSVDHNNGQSGDLIKKIHPSWGYTKQGRPDVILLLHEPLPENVTSHVAHFEDLGKVELEKINPYTLSGFAPESQNPGVKQVTLVLKSANVSREVGSTPFKYVDHGSELIDELLTNKELQSDFFEEFSKQMRSKCSGLQTSDNSGITEAGSLSSSENKGAWSVKVLKVLVYKAAQIGGFEFVKTVFSTSAGKIVFSNYKDSATLPEDAARANGHTTLADYLQGLNTRLSKESSNDTGTENIDWLELKHAVDKEQSLPCKLLPFSVSCVAANHFLHGFTSETRPDR
ncbi:uncharacterized protein LOC110052317 isoform X3 [Orbicella faveolata]|nr:uncharacterized protein LOC110052317 isoform X3 [Orbicella faveolata]